MAALLRTDDERGPLVAAGLVALVVAALLLDARFEDEWAAGGRLVITGLPALLALGIALFAPRPEAPPAWLSAILVAEFVIVLAALANFADAIGAEGQLDSAGTLTWVGLLLTAMAVVSSLRHNSAIMALIAGVVGTITLLAFVDWAFGLDDTLRTFRWLLMLAAIVLGAAGHSLRPTRPRHGVALIDAAGLVVLGLAVTFAISAFIGAISFGGGGGDGQAGWGWELFVLLAGAALIAYAVANREPGPGYLGGFVLLAFVFMAADSGDEPSIVGWPLWLVLIALALLAFALRPRPGAGDATTAVVPPGPGAGDTTTAVVPPRDGPA